MIDISIIVKSKEITGRYGKSTLKLIPEAALLI
jgi:hypothetical protein